MAGYITSTTAAASQTDRNLHVLDTDSLSLSVCLSVHAYVCLCMGANIPMCISIGTSNNSAKGKINTPLSVSLGSEALAVYTASC